MIKRLVKIVLCAVVSIFLITGCNNKKEETDINKELTENISKYNNISKSSFDEYYSPKDSKLIDSKISGLITAGLYELGDDEKEEAIVFSIKNNKLTIEYLKEEENKLENKDTAVIDLIPTYLDELEINAFAIKIENKVKLFIELNGNSSLISDGRLYKLIPIYINNNKIIVEDSISLAGSALFDEDINNYISKVKSTGLNMTNMDETILNQNKDAEKLFTIKREHIPGFELSSAAIIKYGTTKINGYLKNNYESNTDTNKGYSYDDTYLGNYIWANENDSIQFELIKKDSEINFYMSYYPNNSIHASEEIWGAWSTEKNIKLVNNENENALATYSFNDIKYNDNKMEMNIKVNEILNEEYKNHIIPSGTYTFIKK